MSRPVITAILLEDLRRDGHDIRLPADSLVTPAARDWMKDHPVPVTWEDEEDGTGKLAVVMDPSIRELRLMRTMLDRQGGLAEVIEPGAGRSGMVAATRQLCGAVAGGRVARGVLFVQDGALPVCLANKHRGIRAALGGNVPMVEDACRELAVNVLVLEYPALTTYQMKQMIDRLLACSAPAPAETLTAIEALERGGR